MPGFVGAALKHFALQALDSARLALFCRKHGAFMWVYVGFCGCFRGGLLCVFMWVTLLGEAKTASHQSEHFAEPPGLEMATQRFYAPTARALGLAGPAERARTKNRDFFLGWI